MRTSKFFLPFCVSAFLALSLSNCYGVPFLAALSDPNATVINGIGVPKAPGPRNNDTLAGVDANHNGVRDDVEREIAIRYGSNRKHWESAMQSAWATQLGVVADGRKALARRANIEQERDGACVAYAFDGGPQADTMPMVQEGRFVFSRVVNSRARFDAFEASEKVHAPDLPVYGSSACLNMFDPKTGDLIPSHVPRWPR